MPTRTRAIVLALVVALVALTAARLTSGSSTDALGSLHDHCKAGADISYTLDVVQLKLIDEPLSPVYGIPNKDQNPQIRQQCAYEDKPGNADLWVHIQATRVDDPYAFFNDQVRHWETCTNGCDDTQQPNAPDNRDDRFEDDSTHLRLVNVSRDPLQFTALFVFTYKGTLACGAYLQVPAIQPTSFDRLTSELLDMADRACYVVA